MKRKHLLWFMPLWRTGFLACLLLLVGGHLVLIPKVAQNGWEKGDQDVVPGVQVLVTHHVIGAQEGGRLAAVLDSDRRHGVADADVMTENEGRVQEIPEAGGGGGSQDPTEPPFPLEVLCMGRHVPAA